MSTLPDQIASRPGERLSIIVHPTGHPSHAPRVLVPCEGRGCTDTLLASSTLPGTAGSTQDEEVGKGGNAFVASPVSINGDYRRHSKIINNSAAPAEAVIPTDTANRMSVATATVLYPPTPSLPLRIQAPVPITLVLSFWQHLLWVLGPLCLAGALGALLVFLINHFHTSSAVHLVVISVYFFLSFLFLGLVGMEMRTFAQRKWERMVKREELGRSAGQVWRTEQIPLDEWQEWRLRRRDTERSAGTSRKVRSSQGSAKKEGVYEEPLARGRIQDIQLAAGNDDYEEADQTDLSCKEDISSARASYHSRHSVDDHFLTASTRANASSRNPNVDTSEHGTHRYAQSVTDAATIAPSSRLGTQSSQRAPTPAAARSGSAGASSASVMTQNGATVATRSKSSSRGRSRSPSKTTAYTDELSKVANASASASVSASSSAATKGRSATDETAVEGRSADSSRRNSFKNDARQATVGGAAAGVPVPTLAKEATLRAIPTARPAAPWKMPVNMPVSAPDTVKANANTKQAQQAQVVSADRGNIYQNASHHQVYQQHQQQQHPHQQQQHQTQRKTSEQRYPHHQAFPRVGSTSEGDAFADAEESADASLIARGRAAAVAAGTGAGVARAHGRR